MNKRRKQSIWLRRNLPLLIAAAALVLLVLITEVPILRTVFHTAPLSWDEYLYLCCIPFVILGIEELRKLIWRRRFPSERM